MGGIILTREVLNNSQIYLFSLKKHYVFLSKIYTETHQIVLCFMFTHREHVLERTATYIFFKTFLGGSMSLNNHSMCAGIILYFYINMTTFYVKFKKMH